MILVRNLRADILGDPLFAGVSTSIKSGDRIGIVGPNGSGKTTLLRIIAGLHEPDAGSVQIQQERVGYLPQDIEYAEEETVEDFISPVPPAVRDSVMKKVGLEAVGRESLVRNLSGGQKRRLALARVLGAGPTFLLLDEPTNHLDRATIDWLEGFINDFRGGVVLISHDRALLDGTVRKIFEIDPRQGKIKEFVGNYTGYLLEREKQDRLQNEAHERQQREKKRLEAWLARKREEASVYADPSKGKMIRAKQRYLEREIIGKEIPRAGARKSIKGAQLSGEVSNAKLICRFSGVAKSFGDRKILTDASFEVRGKERVLLTGVNGSGKTTLLRMLMDEVEPDAGSVKIGDNIRVGYFSQEQESLDLSKTVLEEFQDTARRIHEKDARAILGSFLFSDQEVFKQVKSLSLGERVRLIFAKLTNQRNEFLVLDEPTNHLDIPSREAIEKALMEYEGAILAVSHDKFFVEKIGFDRTLIVANGTVTEEHYAEEMREEEEVPPEKESWYPNF